VPATFSLANFDDFLLDLDGVLWQGSAPIEGALAAARALLAGDSSSPPSPWPLVRRPRRVFFVTNNSAKTRSEYAAALSQRLGTRVAPERVVTSGWAAAQLLAATAPGSAPGPAPGSAPGPAAQPAATANSGSNGGAAAALLELQQPRPPLPRTVFALGSPALAFELRAAGLCVLTPADHGSGSGDAATMTPETFAAAALDPRVDAVAVGWWPEAWHYGGLCLASAYANAHHRPDDQGPAVDLVATNPDAFNVLMCSTASGSRLRRLPENGCAVAFLEAALVGGASGRRFLAAGKPSAALARVLTSTLQLNPSRTLMVRAANPLPFPLRLLLLFTLPLSLRPSLSLVATRAKHSAGFFDTYDGHNVSLALHLHLLLLYLFPFSFSSSLCAISTTVVPSQVGDRLDTDVCFAAAGAFSSALVLTGVASLADAEAATGPSKPTFVFESLAALVREEPLA
jgi:ribonucleotide monophosphatase NagD (HAD superfamily)